MNIIYFGFHFSLLFITCISSSVARFFFLKKQGSLFSGENSLFFSVLKKVFILFFLGLRP